jgi:hypothetical protein
MSGVLRFPWLLFAYGVERLRRLPGARFVAPLLPWVTRGLFIGVAVLVLLWMAEASPQRISLAELAAGKLGAMQSWIIVSGELADEPGSTESLRLYRLTDPAAPNAYLTVRSRTEWALGHTTISGRLEGGRDGVPPGYAWTARLNADPTLAEELPPPAIVAVLGGLGVLIVLARRSRYPMFVPETPGDAPPAWGNLRVAAHGELDGSADRHHGGTLDFGSGAGIAELRIRGRSPIAVRLHSAFTNVDVGQLQGLRSSEPALHVRAGDDDLTLGFASRRDRDAAFATLAAGAQPLGRPRPPG